MQIKVLIRLVEIKIIVYDYDNIRVRIKKEIKVSKVISHGTDKIKVLIGKFN